MQRSTMKKRLIWNGLQQYKHDYFGKFYSAWIMITFLIGMGTFSSSMFGEFSAGSISDQKNLETSTDIPAWLVPKKSEKPPTKNHPEYYDPTKVTMYAANTQNVEILASEILNDGMVTKKETNTA